ncbi:putative Gnk2-like domain-containing protein [Helianthus annuus]|nr:putative Gnk2-like domain-containing protein [Helianthus annuus]
MLLYSNPSSIKFYFCNIMLMVAKRPNLFFIVIILNIFVLSVSQDITCNDNANFTLNGTYQSNLENALSSLTADTSISYGFYNQSVGQAPDQANVIGLCRGDVEPADCRRCINEASARIRDTCPNQKGAVGWYVDTCMLRYSNVTILGTNPDTSRIRGLINPSNATNVDQFNEGLNRLLNQLRNEASSGGSLRKYAANRTDGPGFSTIYGYMQCTPDLSEIQCLDCLDSVVGNIPYGRRGANLYYPSCAFRYEDYRFLNATVDLAPPSPPPTQSSPPPPPSSPSGNHLLDTLDVYYATRICITSLIFYEIFRQQ